MATIFAKKLYTDSKYFQDQIILTEHGVILDVLPASIAPDAPDIFVDSLSAAFFDLQVNGGYSLNFSESASYDAVADIDRACQETGTGFVLPTLISAPIEHILRGLEAVRTYRDRNPRSGIQGVHLEGPFIAPLRSGAHAHAFIRRPTDQELHRIVEAGQGVIRLMTIAPELFTDEQIDLLLRAGIHLSAGHTNAPYATACRAFDRGIRLVTHLYNAMSPFLARAPGTVGAAFDKPDVSTALILDGIHCDFCAARMAHKIKGEQLFLVSDALFVGRQVQEYHWGEFNARLEGNQYLTHDGHLAGSTISLGEAVRNAIESLHVPLEEAVDMATRRPATVVGLADRIGRIHPGYPSVFTVFDESLQSFRILRV